MLTDYVEENLNKTAETKITISAYPEIELTIQKVIEQFQLAFGQRLVAVYLLGSLSRGGFSPFCSDVDLAFILAGDLTQGDQNQIESFSKFLCQADLPLADKLSIFWESVSNLHQASPGKHARFPEFDRIDLFQSGSLIWGREVRTDHYPQPTQTQLEINGVALLLEKLNNPSAINMIVNPHLLFAQSAIPPSKIVLFPIRLIYTALTGKIGGNEDAVQYYCQNYKDSTAALVEEAFSWCQKVPNKEMLDLEFIRENLLLIYQIFIKIYQQKLEENLQSDLLEKLNQFRSNLEIAAPSSLAIK